jgi:flagellar motor switch protein FliN
MAESTHEMLRFLSGEFSALLAQILGSMTDQHPKVSVSLTAAPDPGGDRLWWKQSLNIAAIPLLCAGAAERTWQELGGRTLRAAGIEAVEPGDAKNTYIEILNQAFAGLAQALSGRLDAEVTCVNGAECAAPPADAEWAKVEIVYPESELPPILIGFHLQLLDRLQNPSPENAAASVEDPANPAVAAPVPLSKFVPQNSRTLDLLLDVELPVSISFGRAELPLKDVLKLTTGSIVELNRGITEPVEVIVNNCVVARGEVVVMDGNYGVRIHQIISPQERLRTLK